MFSFGLSCVSARVGVLGVMVTCWFTMPFALFVLVNKVVVVCLMWCGLLVVFGIRVVGGC